MNIFGKKPARVEFLAIGDMATDAFIRVNDATLLNNPAKPGEKILGLEYGEKIPYEFVEVVPAVGNSANAAVSASRLGIASGLVTDIGLDREGEECLARLKQEKVSTDLIKKHPGLKTNYHYVLWFQKDRTILVKHEKFPHDLPVNTPAPAWIYLSSLGEDSLAYHTQIEKYLDANPKTKLAFQPGTFQIKAGKEAMAGIYKRSTIFFCNVEEAQRILGIPVRDLKVLLTGISRLGVKNVVITDGPNGSYCMDSTGRAYFLQAFPDQKPAYERTGAGDSFSSTVVAGIYKGLTLTEAMKWGSINAMSVVQKIGAQKGLLTVAEVKKYLAQAPAGWEAKSI